MTSPAERRLAIAGELSIQRAANKVDVLVHEAFSLGACKTAREADDRAAQLEQQARSSILEAASRSPSEQLALATLAGSYASRAALWRARAAELRT